VLGTYQMCIIPLTATCERRPTILPGDHSLEVLRLFYEMSG
jgi:hypothetical protein